MKNRETKIYLDLPPLALEALSDNGIDIAEYLSALGVPATIKFEPLPDSDKENRSKDLALVILASGASVGIVGMTIAKILNTIFRRPQKLEYAEYMMIHDTQGNPVLQADGTPRIEKVIRHEIIEPKTEESKMTGEVKLTSEHGISIKFSSASKPTEK
jgi:hypothetical protein